MTGSDIPDTAGKKTRRKKRRGRTQGMAKRYAFHAIAKNKNKNKNKKNAGRNIQKYGWEYSRVEFPRGGGIFRGEFTRGILIAWNFPGVGFPDTVTSTAQLSAQLLLLLFK